MYCKPTLGLERKQTESLKGGIRLGEEWSDILGYEGLYQCSTSGRVRSLDRVVTRKDGREKRIKGVVLKPLRHSHGYATVTLCDGNTRRVWLVHRLVAMTFIPNPDGLPCINHKNENKTDNRIDNLEWCTVAYNNSYGDRVRRIAEKRRGQRHSEETKRRMSAAHKDISPETRRKLSHAATGRKPTPTQRAKMSEYAKSRKRGVDGRWCS